MRAFRIADKTLEAEFWKYYRSDSLHVFRVVTRRRPGTWLLACVDSGLHRYGKSGIVQAFNSRLD